jgi:TPR repeat protein
MPVKLIACMALPPATISSVPIADFAKANEELANINMETYYSCCGKSICEGCIHSFRMSGNAENCPFCKADHVKKTDVERVGELMKRVEVNDAGAMYILGSYYFHGQLGLNQDREKALELWTRAAKLGSSQAHFALGCTYNEGVDSKKSKFHYEAAAMAGHEVARNNLGCMEAQSGNMERSVKHSIIAASAGHYDAMYNLLVDFKYGSVSRDVIDSTLAAYNNSCIEIRSEARDAFIQQVHDRKLE